MSQETHAPSEITDTTPIRIPIAIALAAVSFLAATGWASHAFVTSTVTAAKTEIRSEHQESLKGYVPWREYLERENSRSRAYDQDLKTILTKLDERRR